MSSVSYHVYENSRFILPSADRTGLASSSFQPVQESHLTCHGCGAACIVATTSNEYCITTLGTSTGPNARENSKSSVPWYTRSCTSQSNGRKLHGCHTPRNRGTWSDFEITGSTCCCTAPASSTATASASWYETGVAHGKTTNAHACSRSSATPHTSSNDVMNKSWMECLCSIDAESHRCTENSFLIVYMQRRIIAQALSFGTFKSTRYIYRTSNEPWWMRRSSTFTSSFRAEEPTRGSRLTLSRAELTEHLVRTLLLYHCHHHRRPLTV